MIFFIKSPYIGYNERTIKDNLYKHAIKSLSQSERNKPRMGQDQSLHQH